MAQQVRFRKQTTVAYQANNRVSEPLSRGMIYRELMLRLSGTIDATGNIALSELQPGDEWAVIKNIAIIANGSDVIRNITGEELQWLNLFQNDTPRRPSPFNPPTHPVAFNSSLTLPFWTPKSIRPIDTALDSRQLSDLRIEVTFGDVSSVASSAGASFTVDPRLDVYSLESFGVDGPFAQSRIFRQTDSIAGAMDEYEMLLPVGPMYRGFLISTKNSSNVDQANLIENIKIISGTTVFLDLPGKLCRDWFMARNGVEQFKDSSGNIVPYFGSTNSNLDGWYYVDLVTDGFLSEAIDTLGFSELKLQLKTTGAISKLAVLPMVIIPVRGKAG